MDKQEEMINSFLSAEKSYSFLNDSDSWNLQRVYVLEGFLGEKYRDNKNNREALAYYTKAVNIAKSYYDLTKESKTIEHIVVLLRELQSQFVSKGDYKKANSCAETAKNYAKRYMERFSSAYTRLLYAETLCQMADAHANLGKTDSVDQQLVECLKKSEFASSVFSNRYQQLSSRIYTAFATCYFKQDYHEKALHAVNKAINTDTTYVMAYLKKKEILKAMGKNEEVDRISNQLLNMEDSSKKRSSTGFFIYSVG